MAASVNKNATSRLFKGMRLGEIELQHRVCMAPLTRFRTSDSHEILSMAVEYYTQRCSTPGTLIIAEASMISPENGGVPNMPGIYTESQIGAWKAVTDAVHAKGCSIFCQLIAVGRASNPDQLQKEGGHRLISASALPIDAASPTPSEMTEEQIQRAISQFGQASKNAIAAGFDGVEIHGANGYLVDCFIQSVSNHRTDQWGGDIEKRARFAVEVAKSAVEAVGASRVGFRISPWSLFQGMKMDDPVPQFVRLVQLLKALDIGYLHIIESRVTNSFDVEKTEGIEPFLEAWGQEKPVLVAGGFTPAVAIEAVDREYRDYNVAVVFGRFFISTPDLPFRVKNGLPLNAYDRSTFYAAKQKEGYLDYPFSQQFLEQVKV
ncbi:probable NADH:flavin oxidoreductase/12-oxophytodienoate reductase [Ramularia collo-cygni]|uniref:Probable NADH:flavin oxidoreductase/12-oxophytodienoate reductase n=1 Tax=Ramularia collo-cygni TaxID=112498 RepID=A0A2D3UVQ5_9PEZI|nr:probable NADH:flavin oxidoreductase/12-oxophytodienoate reductase [Ramularia collo-cygni]CZT19368.1 probable NADH:flavin oxidoreductase/12-oxophytodienoate reductase [Ramularia collo-cygni]